jgi:hypothetical protein
MSEYGTKWRERKRWEKMGGTDRSGNIWRERASPGSKKKKCSVGNKVEDTVRGIQYTEQATK